MSSDSSSECTQEEMPMVRVKIEPDSDSDEDSLDPLSVLVESETSCDPLSPADNTRPDHAGDPLSPAGTESTPNDPLTGEQTSTDQPEDEDSMSDLIEETSCDPLLPSNKAKPNTKNDPLNATKSSHNVPTLIGLLGKNGTVIGNRIVLVPKTNQLSVKTKSPQSKPSADPEGSSDVSKVPAPTKKYTCLRCGFQTDFDSELRDHMKTKHPEGLRNDYQKKTQKDAVTKPFKCYLCNTYFPKEDMLNVHLGRLHPKTAVRLEKPTPPKSYSGPRAKLKSSKSTAEYKEIKNLGPRANLAEELKDELLKGGLKRLACDQCKFITTKYCYLRKHQRKIHGDKRRDCEFCDFTTSKYSNFVKHQKNHAAEKPYICDFCDFASYKKSRLKQHRQLKHGISPDSEQCDSTTTVELESSTRDAETEIDIPNETSGKRPFITDLLNDWAAGRVLDTGLRLGRDNLIPVMDSRVIIKRKPSRNASEKDYK